MTKLALAALALAGCAVDGAHTTTSGAALTPDVCPAETPATLAPDADRDLAFTLYATGAQIYECRPTATGAAWALKAPDADLYDAEGNHVGRHYAGPTWEFEDGSFVVGAKRVGVTVDPTAVQWLLLDVTRHGDVAGRMSKVTAIQRLSTTEGLAPSTGCDVDHLGATYASPYTTDYFFYRTRTTQPQLNLRCGAR
jgi:hypothetical protein